MKLIKQKDFKNRLPAWLIRICDDVQCVAEHEAIVSYKIGQGDKAVKHCKANGYANFDLITRIGKTEYAGCYN